MSCECTANTVISLDPGIVGSLENTYGRRDLPQCHKASDDE